jgi:hypothetical protein
MCRSDATHTLNWNNSFLCDLSHVKIWNKELLHLSLIPSKDSDCGVCSWPWQSFELGKADHSLVMTSDWYIPVKITLGWSTVAFCACEIIKLFSVVFFVVTAVHVFDFRLKCLTNCDQWKGGLAVIEIYVFGDIYILPRIKENVSN